MITFGLKAGVDILDGAASLNAQVSGWIDAPNNQFAVSGSGQGCLGGVCAKASGVISSTGIAGCVTVGTTSPTYDLIIPLDGRAPYLDTRTYELSAGFGYVWGASSADFLGGSCNFSAYQPTRPAGTRAAAAGSRLGLRVAHGTDAVALRVHGTDGPPKVVVRGPRGTTIASPSGASGKLRKGHYLLVENKSDGTTGVLLVHPAAGTWTVSPAPGAASSPTKIDRANVEVPPTFGARVLGKGAIAHRAGGLRGAGGSVGATARAGEGRQPHDRQGPARPPLRRSAEAAPGHEREDPLREDPVPSGTRPGDDAQGGGGCDAAVASRSLQKNIASFRVPRPTLPSRVPCPAREARERIARDRVLAVDRGVTLFRVRQALRRARARARPRRTMPRGAYRQRPGRRRRGGEGRGGALRPGDGPLALDLDQGQRAVGRSRRQEVPPGQGLHLKGAARQTGTGGSRKRAAAARVRAARTAVVSVARS